MRIIIAGAGAVGTHLAKMLSDERHDIVLMDAEVKITISGSIILRSRSISPLCEIPASIIATL